MKDHSEALAPPAAAARATIRATMPAGYRWQKHVALIAVFIATGGILTVGRLDGLTPIDAFWLLGMFAFLNLGEYAAHRWPLHRPLFPRAVYHRHVVEHHAFFSYEAMAVKSWQDLRWVLFPWWALPLLVATVVPFALLLGLTAGSRLGWLFLLAVILYYGSYEILHALAHLPDEVRWARQPWVRRLTHHHRVHHDPRLMRRYNFSFVIPICDLLFGTKYRSPAVPETQRVAR